MIPGEMRQRPKVCPYDGTELLATSEHSWWYWLCVACGNAWTVSGSQFGGGPDAVNAKPEEIEQLKQRDEKGAE